MQVNSPGIDAGNNSFVSSNPGVTDVANNPRIYNETVDIGAFEYGLYLSIDDVTVQEGNEGTTNAEFTVTLLDTLGQPTTSEVSVLYGTENNTAENTSDFESTSGTLVFAPGETEKTVTVAVNGDTDPENDETFFVNLANPTGAAVINDSQGRALIQNEDILAEGATVYRFLETEAQTQFYTTSELERDTVIETLPNYEYEGESFIGAPDPEGDDIIGITPVYRLFNTSTGVHLYTASEIERDSVIENLPNYTPEGISYYGYQTQQEGTVPLYRFYNQSLDAHFYTPSAEERDEFLASPDYQLEGDNGIAFYVEPVEV